MKPTMYNSVVSTKIIGILLKYLTQILIFAFSLGKTPNIYNALVVKGQDTVGRQINVTCEVQHSLGGKSDVQLWFTVLKIVFYP